MYETLVVRSKTGCPKHVRHFKWACSPGEERREPGWVPVRGVCGLLQRGGDNITEIPKWNGTTISYRGRQKPIKRQSNTVIIPILDEFEKGGWPENIKVPSNLDGDPKQAIYHLNQKGVIRLSLHGDLISW